MIGRVVLLTLLAAGAWGAWWVVTSAHRRRLQERVSADPHTVTVFTSPGCAACRTQERIVASLRPDEVQRIRWIDVTRQPEEAVRFGVMTLPTTIFFGPLGEVAGISYGVTGAAAIKRNLARAG